MQEEQNKYMRREIELLKNNKIINLTTPPDKSSDTITWNVQVSDKDQKKQAGSEKAPRQDK